MAQLYKVRVSETRGEKSETYYTLAEDIDSAMERALSRASEAWIEEVNLVEVVSASEVNGEWIP